MADVAPEIFRALLEPDLIQNEPPGQDPFFSVGEQALIRLANGCDRSLTETMADCLKLGVWPERFRANRGTFSTADQLRLLKSSVALIGAGGLGGAAALFMARVGIGRLIICDGDHFVESNLNRQAFSNLDRLGLNKAICAAEEIRRINPVVEVVLFPTFATDANLPDILREAEVVVDCLDNLTTRLTVERAARRRGIPFVHGAIAGLEGFVMTVFPEDPGLEALYGQTAASKADSAETVLGTPAVTPVLVAGLQASETINILLKRQTLARGRLLHVDLSTPAIEALAIS